MAFEVHHLEHVVDEWVNVVHLFWEDLLEKIAHGELELIARDDLPRERNREPLFDMYSPVFRLNGACDESEYRAFARAILTHEGNLGTAAYGERELVEDWFARRVFKRNILEAHYRIFRPLL